MKGIIVKNISDDYTINCQDKLYTCKPRGKFRLQKITPLVGDKVIIGSTGDIGKVPFRS